MRELDLESLDDPFQREFIWNEDRLKFHHQNRRKASVMNYRARIFRMLDLVKTHSPGPRVADLACGQGNLALLIAEAGFDVTAVDIKNEFLDYARKKHTHGQIQFALGNVMEFRSPQPFDCVILGEIIEHVAYPKELLKSAAENLRPGGILVLSTPNGRLWGSTLPTYREIKDPSHLIAEQFHWENHLFLYTDDELRELFGETGFETVAIEKINSQFVHEIKGLRYLMPLFLLEWLDKKTSAWSRDGKERTNNLIAVARRLA